MEIIVFSITKTETISCPNRKQYLLLEVFNLQD